MQDLSHLSDRNCFGLSMPLFTRRQRMETGLEIVKALEDDTLTAPLLFRSHRPYTLRCVGNSGYPDSKFSAIHFCTIFRRPRGHHSVVPFRIATPSLERGQHKCLPPRRTGEFFLIMAPSKAMRTLAHATHSFVPHYYVQNGGEAISCVIGKQAAL